MADKGIRQSACSGATYNDKILFLLRYALCPLRYAYYLSALSFDL
jgi:hypothetical protein